LARPAGSREGARPMVLYIKWNSLGRGLLGQRFSHYSTSCVSLTTPGTQACDAVGGALRPKWREWSVRSISRVLSERVAFGTLVAALFALLPSCP